MQHCWFTIAWYWLGKWHMQAHTDLWSTAHTYVFATCFKTCSTNVLWFEIREFTLDLFPPNSVSKVSVLMVYTACAMMTRAMTTRALHRMQHNYVTTDHVGRSDFRVKTDLQIQYHVGHIGMCVVFFLLHLHLRWRADITLLHMWNVYSSSCSWGQDSSMFCSLDVWCIFDVNHRLLLDQGLVFLTDLRAFQWKKSLFCEHYLLMKCPYPCKTSYATSRPRHVQARQPLMKKVLSEGFWLHF